MALRKNEVENPLLPRIILTFKKEKLFCSKSNVNFKFLCLVFVYLANDSKLFLDLNKTNMSSIHLSDESKTFLGSFEKLGWSHPTKGISF